MRKSKTSKSKPIIQSGDPNPYLALLNQTVAETLKLDVARIQPDRSEMAHILPDNDWIHPRLCEKALVLAYAWSSPLTTAYRDPGAWQQMEKLLKRVLEKGQAGRWWREQPGTGDPNVNRFTLLPLTELFLRVGAFLGNELKTQGLAVIEKAAVYQVQSYHDYPKRQRGEYPNMDAYFMLIMEEAARLLDRADYHAMALEYLEYLDACIFEDGGFVYVKDTNECEVYHQINVLHLVRFGELTHSARVREVLRKTLPYYPNVVEPCGMAEHYTDPFWKHYWSPVSPVALDALATLFAGTPWAGEHRYLANVLRPQLMAEKCGGMHLIWALDYWQPDRGTAPKNPWVRYDASIRGPRGRFGSFSWAGTPAVWVDTFVGAMVADGREKLSSLQAAGVELALKRPVPVPTAAYHGRRLERAAYVSDADYLRRMILADDHAWLAVHSPVFPGMIPWEKVENPGWWTTQVWMMNGQRLVGMMALEALPGAEANVTKAAVYFRLGGNRREVTERDGTFVRDQLVLRLAQHSFDAVSLEAGYQFYLDRNPTSTEVTLASPVTSPGKRRFMALVEIYPEWESPSVVKPLEDERLAGFEVSASRSRIRVAFNCQSIPIPPGPAKGKTGGACYRTSSGQPQTRMVRSTPDGEVNPGELVVWMGK